MNAPPRARHDVVGVSFTDHYPDNLHALAAAQAEAEQRGEPLTVVLVRNPGNIYDSNAIEVHVPALGSYAMIGHIRKEIAKRFAPDMDEGVVFDASVSWVRIHPDHPDRPGITVEIWKHDDAT